MNICIVTVYKGNCGTCLQAYSTYKILKEMGHNVVFLFQDTPNGNLSFKQRIKTFLIKCLKLEFNAAKLLLRSAKAYKEFEKRFPTIEIGGEDIKNIDLFVLGSDTIWNFNSPYFYVKRELYTGKAFGTGKSITYAASAANTPYEVFLKDEDIKTAINNLKAISVRDDNTKELVKKLTGREASIVCDPTMLVEKHVFDELAIDIPDKKYILVYTFAALKKDEQEEILRFKEKHGLTLISFGEYRPWCDKSIPYDVNAFVSYMKNADFVITNTFHGTIFAIINNKVFAEYGIRQKKISDLLNQLELTNSVVCEERCIEDVFENGLDYSRVNEKIKVLRENSLRYLKENLLEN